MSELVVNLLLLCVGTLPLALLVPVIGRRYIFSRSELTVFSLGVLPLRIIPFEGVRLEAVGRPGMELTRLRERLPGRRIVDLTRFRFLFRGVCGFVSTPDSLYILPHAVARALISRNPPARWNLLRLETRRRLTDLPLRTLEAWPRRLRIAKLCVIALLAAMAITEITITAQALMAFYRDYVSMGVALPLLKTEVARIALCQLSAPLLVIACAIWMAIPVWQHRRPPVFLILLTLLAVLGGIPLYGLHAHELSHEWGESCTAYEDALRPCQILSGLCCTLLLARPVLERVAAHRPPRLALPVE
ncbi:MAG: hypothetical protein QM755_02285 [Luteolibacter sp.]